MRTLVLMLLIALLPLRMWAAQDMGVQMAQQQAGSAQLMPADCPMMAHAAAEDGAGGESPTSTAHCLACQLCAGAACLPDLAIAPSQAPAGPPATGTSRYLSAQLAPDLRPPIS